MEYASWQHQNYRGGPSLFIVLTHSMNKFKLIYVSFFVIIFDMFADWLLPSPSWMKEDDVNYPKHKYIIVQMRHPLSSVYLTSGVIALIILSTSSSAKSSGISPEASMSLMSTRNLSSATCESVIKNMMLTFFRPAFRYKPARSLWKLVKQNYKSHY